MLFNTFPVKRLQRKALYGEQVCQMWLPSYDIHTDSFYTKVVK